MAHHNKILLIGYQRSGTTLLRRLIQAHPDVYKMFHETWLLTGIDHGKIKQHYRIDLGKLAGESERTWGEKLAYTASRMEGEFRDPAILVYMKIWMDLFGDEARVVHILRHPIDAGLSATKLKWAKSPQAVLKNYSQIVPKVLAMQDKMYTMKYEDLVRDPHVALAGVYNYCELPFHRSIIDNTISQGLRNLEMLGDAMIHQNRVLIYKQEKYSAALAKMPKKPGDLLKKLNQFGDCPYNWVRE